ncbi:hypothetical protein TNCV_4389301 [Trichonephila clavipes]|nr:hypothetical protein TNCV_4389301 [Trichonephila clavipes]
MKSTHLVQLCDRDATRSSGGWLNPQPTRAGSGPTESKGPRKWPPYYNTPDGLARRGLCSAGFSTFSSFFFFTLLPTTGLRYPRGRRGYQWLLLPLPLRWHGARNLKQRKVFRKSDSSILRKVFGLCELKFARLLLFMVLSLL